ncbi:hypothetical protein HYPDE_33658 [Hyphomicrobium denitrificans 1NES1]|uniref:Uncharacterized protein n=2 Tax=Hyphomicrobium denitrificans TaxID=53399 RepID=N0B4F5_9HYPH|nr:hypothetical protein HYPDE_33658 [Hyphomicrobium denitrificans 1NES1]
MASAVLSSASWVKTFPYVDAMASPAMWNAPAARNVSVRATKFARHNGVASAVKPLDLRKLTMADFGDVEDPR